MTTFDMEGMNQHFNDDAGPIVLFLPLSMPVPPARRLFFACAATRIFDLSQN
jgi:hypothetical protein